jgi:SAM-dependent methyltransferase
MVRQARENASTQGVDVSFLEAGFGAIAPAVEGAFDAVLCLGNSLPHVLTHEHLLATFQDWFSVLRPGGLLLVQSRNLERVVAQGERWMPPRSSRQGDREWIFLRFYDFEGDGSLAFHMVTLTREAGSPWQQQETTTRLWPWKHTELVHALDQVGFQSIEAWGDVQGSVYERESPNLVLSATRGER